MFHAIRAAVAVAFVSVGSAALAVPINDASLLPNSGPSSTLPDLNTSLIFADTLSYTDNGDGRGVLSISANPSFLEFEYTDVGGILTPISVDASLSITATFDPNGEVATSLGGTGSGSFGGSFSVNGTPNAPISELTGNDGDPILLGTLAAVGTSLNTVEIIWQVTGGRASNAFGTYIYTQIGSTSFNYSEFSGLSFFTVAPGFGEAGIDSKPGQVVPLPPAGLALLAGIGAFGLLRRNRRA